MFTCLHFLLKFQYIVAGARWLQFHRSIRHKGGGCEWKFSISMWYSHCIRREPAELIFHWESLWEWHRREAFEVAQDMHFKLCQNRPTLTNESFHTLLLYSFLWQHQSTNNKGWIGYKARNQGCESWDISAFEEWTKTCYSGEQENGLISQIFSSHTRSHNRGENEERKD